MLRLSKKILIIIFLALVLRVIITFWSLNFRENTDVLRYKDWARIAYLYGFSDTYTLKHLQFGTLANNQPPGSLYIISAAYNAQLQTAKLIGKITKSTPGSNTWINGPLMDIFLRIPSIIADLLLGICIYTFIKAKYSEKQALIGSILFLFNPIVLYNSAFWGQMDSLNNLFFILALFCFLKKKYFLSILFYCLSVYIKLSLLIYLPIFLLLLFFSTMKKMKLLLYLITNVFLFFILTLPISLQSYQWLPAFIIRSVQGETQNITVFALNFWWMVYKPIIAIGKPTNLFHFSEVHLFNAPLSSLFFLGISLSVWGYFLFIAFLSPFLYKVWSYKNKLSADKIFLLFSLTALLGFLFLPQMHERYMYPLFPLLATYIGIKRKFLWIYIILSLLNLINLYLVWHPMHVLFFSYVLMNNRLFQWFVSILTFAAAIIFYIKSFYLFSIK